MCVVLLTAVRAASAAEADRLRAATAVIQELRETPEGIPEDIWNRSECVIVIPSMKKAAFIVGGEFGKGVMSCRTAHGWSAPVFMDLAKGSLGFQIGAQEVDLVLLMMNRRGVDRMLNNKVTLGADASVAAGPVGRTAAAGTDAALTAEILSYSRSRGIFAGIDLSGGVLKPDKDLNEKTYGRNMSPNEVLSGTAKMTDAAAKAFVTALDRAVRATTGTR
jgi:lipid-binding SYLF domain-containing protein